MRPVGIEGAALQAQIEHGPIEMLGAGSQHSGGGMAGGLFKIAAEQRYRCTAKL
ncbi:MAG: hypothetical protein OHK0037_00160 [Elainellaceae cyanobacterium]